MSFKSLLKPFKKKKKNIDHKSVFKKSDAYLDRDEFKYVLWLDRMYSKIAQTPGHIVEIGVARGRNAILLSQLIRMHGDDSVRQYVGFDTFEGYTQEDIATTQHLSEDAWSDISREFVETRVNALGLSDICSFVEGDIKVTADDFLKNSRGKRHSPGNFRAALLYIDCNAYAAAMAGMNAFIDFMSPGGIICIDEKLQGGETRALIEFCQARNLRFMKDDSPFAMPAYTRVGETTLQEDKRVA